MGEHEKWSQPIGLVPNGLLPTEVESVIHPLDEERWSKAEERTAELIDCIQPNEPSEERRNAVAHYVQRLIMNCFPCQVFTFGSVPLKTYLPDGDIDLTAFCKNPIWKDTWASQVRDILDSEEKNENAEFRVKEVQYIQAEVKIIKCLVENIVVDISFNQLGGLCTLCFLDEVDHLINQDHLFKRSIILIKAWCYYESRILGAHHGLISTYALETLVLYIFHVFNNSFAGPLEVLYRFLEFFSNFDWDNFCVSLWGPVPIRTLPDVTADPPRKDEGELLLSKLFLQACSAVYAVFPGGQENQGQPFISKHFNVIDPLRVNNNLGRSVSKGNFYRIRSAFSFGAKRMARLLDCPKENITFELNQFFMNTWERHGSGIRPDVPTSDIGCLNPSNPDSALGGQRNAESGKKINDNASADEIEVEVLESARLMSSQRVSHPLESIFKSKVGPPVSHTQGHKSHRNQNSSRIPDQTEKGNSFQNVQLDRNQRRWKPDRMRNELQGKYLFARTRSSPELTDAYCNAYSRSRRNNNPGESSEVQVTAVKRDINQRKNIVSEITSTQNSVPPSVDPSSGSYSSTHLQVEVAADSSGVSNVFVDNTEDHQPIGGTQGLHQEQNLVNMMASHSAGCFGGQVPVPMNLASTHLTLPNSQSVLTSLGYAPRNMAEVLPANISMVDPQWASNLHLHNGLMTSPLTHYYPRVGLSTTSEDSVEQLNDNFVSVNMVCRDSNTESWHERDASSDGAFVPDYASSETSHVDDRQPSTSATSNFVSSSHMHASGVYFKAQQKLTKGSRGSTRDDCVESFQHQDNQGNEIDSEDRVSSGRFSSASQSSWMRIKTSESSWDGVSSRVSKTTRDKWGRRTATAVATPPSPQGKGKTVFEHASSEADDESGDWNTVSTMGNEIDDKSTTSQSTSTLHVSRHQFPGFQGSQMSGSDSAIPIGPMILGSGSRQKLVDNSGAYPIFYPAGPPVPFLTMLPVPVYNYSTDSGTCDASNSHLGRGNSVANSDSGQNNDSSEAPDASDVLNSYGTKKGQIFTGISEGPKHDILHSDFASHWQNLQFGRFCQSPRHPSSVVYPSPVVGPPMYLQGRIPWDGPGRPLAANANIMSQLTNFGPRVVPVAPLPSVSNRSPAVYQRYGDELPRYRSGTGTYLPNPKPSFRDRNSGTRKNNHIYERSDNGDREGNWNSAKSRAAAGRSQNRSQVEKSRIDRLATNDNRADRPWGTYRNEPLSQHQPPNSPVRSNPSQTSSANVGYGMYPMSGMNQSRVTSNGPTSSSVVMLYPYDQNSGYVSPGEQLEFGSLGPVGFVGMTDTSSQPANATQVRGTIENQRFRSSSSTQHSSPDQPSSPHFQHRRI